VAGTTGARSSDPPALASLVAGVTGAHHHTWLIFFIFVGTRFHYVGQTGLELLTSSDLPASASQGAGITGVSHCTWPTNILTDAGEHLLRFKYSNHSQLVVKGLLVFMVLLFLF
uniref:Uncharacterized protein n=1 Tax=Piliocolobus tephrosceles TaxID=591936 RepID=A0A8C9LNQ0_9PRIM